MLVYELTTSAQEDLKGIARYTLTKWGKAQSLRYAELLEKRFLEIAERTVFSRSFSERFPQILVTRCEHHYIFYVHPENKPPRIMAILHENMDLLKRLAHRLD
jgi:toxin ParE1/3/4